MALNRSCLGNEGKCIFNRNEKKNKRRGQEHVLEKVLQLNVMAFLGSKPDFIALVLMAEDL